MAVKQREMRAERKSNAFPTSLLNVDDIISQALTAGRTPTLLGRTEDVVRETTGTENGFSSIFFIYYRVAESACCGARRGREIVEKSVFFSSENIANSENGGRKPSRGDSFLRFSSERSLHARKTILKS